MQQNGNSVGNPVFTKEEISCLKVEANFRAPLPKHWGNIQVKYSCHNKTLLPTANLRLRCREEGYVIATR